MTHPPHAPIRGLRLAFALALLILLPAGTALAQDEPVDEAETQSIQLGFETYTSNCQGCHQSGGVGIEGTFPPLVNNPNVEDAAYVADTIRNGRQGPIEVNGVTYDGVMPAFATLSDEQVDGLVAYIQAGFVVPGGGEVEVEALPVATGTLPELSSMAIAAAFVIAAGAALWVLSPHIVSRIDRVTVPWLDGWLRSILIFVLLVLAIAVIPSLVLQMETVGKLPRPLQDVIGLVLWSGGLIVGLLALWYAHRERRI